MEPNLHSISSKNQLQSIDMIDKCTIEVSFKDLSERSGIPIRSIPKFLEHLVEDGMILNFQLDQKNKLIIISVDKSLELFANSDLFQVDDSENL
jgi:hypothetical protein